MQTMYYCKASQDMKTYNKIADLGFIQFKYVMYFAMIPSINNIKEKERMFYDGYVEHVISSKVAISEMWNLAPFIILFIRKTLRGKQILNYKF